MRHLILGIFQMKPHEKRTILKEILKNFRVLDRATLIVIRLDLIIY